MGEVYNYRETWASIDSTNEKVETILHMIKEGYIGRAPEPWTDKELNLLKPYLIDSNRKLNIVTAEGDVNGKHEVCKCFKVTDFAGVLWRSFDIEENIDPAIIEYLINS